MKSFAEQELEIPSSYLATDSNAFLASEGASNLVTGRNEKELAANDHKHAEPR